MIQFKMPKASKKSLNQLLDYLGDRTNDFIECFDIKSKWCKMYADLVLRTIKPRSKEELGCSPERHHIVPFCLYKSRGYTGDRWDDEVSSNNVGCMSYGEHIFAHYFMALCGKGNIPGKMGLAFSRLWKGRRRGWGRELPTIEFVLKYIGEAEANRVASMNGVIARLEAEGRTHWSVDTKQARKDYYEMHGKARQQERRRNMTAEERAEEARKRREYRKDNIEKCREQDRRKNERTRRMKASGMVSRTKRHWSKRDYERDKKYKQEHRKEINERNRRNRKDPVRGEQIRCNDRIKYIHNRDKKLAARKRYRKKHPERVKQQKHNHYMKNREMLKDEQREYRARKKAAGYKVIRDPVTGSRHWVFVGLPEKVDAA